MARKKSFQSGVLLLLRSSILALVLLAVLVKASVLLRLFYNVEGNYSADMTPPPFKPTTRLAYSVSAAATRPMARSPENAFYRATVVVSHSPEDHGAGGQQEPCKCELVSVDCLDSIRCMPQRSQTKQFLIALGVMTRKLIKQTARFSGQDRPWSNAPVGKTVQYTTGAAWKRWFAENELPISYRSEQSIFVNETWYPFCQQHGLRGKSCFLGDLTAHEDLDDLELEALGNVSLPQEIIGQIRTDLVQFRNDSLSGGKLAPPALGYLLSFAHIARIRFNRQPPIRDAYNKHIERVSNIPSGTDGVIRVSLHMRRADSCSHAETGYAVNASELDSIAQVSGKRLCYATSVYMDALRRVEKLSGKPLDVYLSTDHAGSVMDEIRTNYKEEYNKWDWNVLNYSRDIFKYEGMIEGGANDKQGILGESAVVDLWHLSHGEVFVGNLGSRFGKVSWLLSMARRNTFVPFFTVDGHSFCCEIDEQCGNMAPYISSMDNCMTFRHDSVLTGPNVDYWEVGSEMRKIVAERPEKNTGITFLY